MKTNTICI